jgi:surface antigen Omp85-like protein
MYKLIALIIAFALLPMCMMAEEAEETSAPKNFRITPFIAPAYTPELGMLVTAGGLMSMTTDMSDPTLQRSSLPISIGYTSTGAIVFNARLSSFWMGDFFRWNMDLWYKDMPDNYWGIGYENGRDNVKSDSTTAYDRVWWQFNPKLLFRPFDEYPEFHAGLNIDINSTEASNPNSIMNDDPNYQQFGSANLNSGLGIVLQYDSRDIAVNAWEGMYLGFIGTFYGDYLGSDNKYEVYDIDYRQYLTIGRKGQTISWQFRSRTASGDVPWAEMSQIGTPFDLRGYTWGRYRDKAMLYMILEYRLQFTKDTPNRFGEMLSPHGMVLWLAGGSINDKPQDFDAWLPNFGVGYRFEAQPRMNIRLDFGFAQELTGWTPAIYFNFNEAF